MTYENNYWRNHAFNRLTWQEKECMDEVIEQYDLTDEQDALVRKRVNAEIQAGQKAYHLTHHIVAEVKLCATSTIGTPND